jgi:hypothetical protein
LGAVSGPKRVADQCTAKLEGFIMPNVASAQSYVTRGDATSSLASSSRLMTSPPTDQSAALMLVANRLIAIADNPATQWSEIARVSARKAAMEMLQQASKG